MNIKRSLIKINLAALVVAGSMATSIAFACYGVNQPTCPENPPGKTGCVNANAPSDNYETLTTPATGALNESVTGCMCTYDCPGDNPNDPTCWGNQYSLTGTCGPG
jgi:hypothetical protein